MCLTKISTCHYITRAAKYLNLRGKCRVLGVLYLKRFALVRLGFTLTVLIVFFIDVSFKETRVHLKSKQQHQKLK